MKRKLSGGTRERGGDGSSSEDAPIELDKVEETVIARTTEKLDTVDSDKEKLKQRKVEAEAEPGEGHRGDGVFYMTFLQMGQGDGAIISTPAGKRILIDCGTVSTDHDNAGARKDCKALLKKAIYLGDTKTIDILVLTHPDRDHYTWVKKVAPRYKIGTVYHSQQLKDYSVGKCNSYFKRRVDARTDIKRVVHNATKVTLAGVDVRDRLRETDTDVEVKVGGGIRIVDEPHCKITILAAEVAKDTDVETTGDGINAGSVVTLIEVHGDKILVVGDATYSTENYLMATYPDLLKGLDMLQVGHHGSACTSSQNAWVTFTNAKMAIICAGKQVMTNHLPRSETVWRYHEFMNDRTSTTRVDAHKVFFWRKKAGGDFAGFEHEFLNMTVPLQGTGTGKFSYFVDPPTTGTDTTP